MKIIIPDGAKMILNQLHTAGYEAYVVGGCVRDALLGRIPDDWDITTSAKPLEVKALFDHTIDTGLQHGTVTVMVDKIGYEVTTYRVDGEYEDHRRPNEVVFTSSLKEDMQRRDFTINAMAYNDEDGLVDHFEGQQDLEKKMIRCVGNAMDRFDEDALRVMRAMRFSAQLDFAIEEETYEAMKTQSRYLKDVSAERIRVELTKLLLSDHPDRLISVGCTTGIVDIILPEFQMMLATAQENPYHAYDVGVHCMKTVEYAPKDVCMRYSALLHDVGKPQVKTIDENGIAHFYQHAKEGTPIAVTIMQRLKFDNDTIKKMRELIYWHDYNWGNSVNSKTVRRAMRKIGPDLIDDLLVLQRCDTLAQSELHKQEKLELLDKITTLVEAVREESQCVTAKELAISGKDLIELGMKPSKSMGEMIEWLLDQVVDCPEYNTKEKLLELVQMRSK